MIVLFHDGGPAPCGDPALGLLHDHPTEYELPAGNVLKLDGTRPQTGEYIFCGSCGAPLYPHFLRKRG